MPKINQLLKSDFVKNSSILVVGTILAQLIPILVQPIIRRIYTDSQTGQLDLYLSFVAILSSFVHLNYAQTIVIPKEDKSAINLLAGSLISSFFISLFVFFVFIFAGEYILTILNLPMSFLPWLKYIPLSIFFIGCYTSITFWLTRKKRFKAIALNKFSRRTGESGVQVFSKNISSNGLIFGNIIGDVINLFSNIIQLKNTKINYKQVSKKDIKKEFVNYKKFPIYSLLPTLLDSLSSNLPVIMVTAFFSDKIAGQFGLSRMVLAIPLALISVSISQVLLQKVSEKRQNKESIKKLILNTVFFLSSISIVGTIIIYFFSEPIFTFAFGSEWELAAEMSRILIFYFCISFVITPISTIFIALEKIRINSIWQTLHFLSICSLFIFNWLNVYDFTYMYSFVNVISYITYGFLMFITTKNYEKGLL